MSGLRLPLRFLSVLLLCCAFESSFLMINVFVVGLSACHPGQIQALMEFKTEFDSRGCNQSDYFNGVGCDNTTGAVTVLQLPIGCLSGILKPNSSLFRFHHLRYLNLSYNDFTSSSLPFEFGNLNKLEVLDLSFNGFQGQVPSSFSNLSQLTNLDLSFNELTGSLPLVQNLTKLSILRLTHNHFFGTIPSSLFTMPFLSTLNLRSNYLTGPIEVTNSFSSSILEVLLLGQNQFQGKILEPISKLVNLETLDLSFLNRSYPVDLSLLSSLKSLTTLDLTFVSISPASLSSDSGIPLSLKFLGLSGCDIREFPNIFKSLQDLEQIELGDNQIQGKVPEWLWDLPHVKMVDLVNNYFNGFEGSTEVLVNSSVRILSLDANNFQGPFPIPPISINVLTARENSFTGDIPFSICNRGFLDLLDLSYNNFSGPIPPCLSNVTIVMLRKNGLEGSIPDDFHSGALIQTLDVGYNRLTGKLPRSLVNCSSLRFLAVDHNRIKDTFPFWLKTLPDFQVFTLRSNKFYGPMSPPDQGPLGFPELRIIEISNNQFTGGLPPSFFVNWKASLVKMNEDRSIYMQYSKNAYANAYYWIEDVLDLQYKGLNMEQVRVLTFYSTVDFSGNRLEGPIPESIGLLKALIALNLSNNAFTGHIPLSLANLTELESLDLSRNQLSGTIPNGLGSLSFLAYVNVSHNQLKGEIPQGTQITGQPKSSFEGNAGLCGLPLQESCFGTTAPPIQQSEQEDDDEEEVLNWKAVAIGYGPGFLLGLAICQVIASYNPEWLVNIIFFWKKA